jgi:hypothetical protein
MTEHITTCITNVLIIPAISVIVFFIEKNILMAEFSEKHAPKTPKYPLARGDSSTMHIRGGTVPAPVQAFYYCNSCFPGRAAVAARGIEALSQK